MIVIKLNETSGKRELFDTEKKEFIEFDRKNVLHVAIIKMDLLIDAANTLLHFIYCGKTINDVSTDCDDCDNLETYWLDALFTNDDFGVNEKTDVRYILNNCLRSYYPNNDAEDSEPLVIGDSYKLGLDNTQTAYVLVRGYIDFVTPESNIKTGDAEW